jgi:hypothetical protein
MFFTMDQVIAHIVGDFVLQSDWMALNKSKKTWIALVHGVLYTTPFLVFTRSVPALLFIALTHAVIDRFGIPKYISWAHNFLSIPWIPRWRMSYRCSDCGRLVTYTIRSVLEGTEFKRVYPDKLCAYCGKQTEITDCAPTTDAFNLPWSECKATGYNPDRPMWLTLWLLIIVDNTLHLALNACALRWL